MINVPIEVQDALNRDVRQTMPKVNLYINGNDNDPLVLGEDDIVSWDVLEELASSTDKPIGNVCSNELTVELYNNNDRFTITNENSPYYDKMLPGVKIETFISVKLRDNSFYDIPMGVFYVEDWESSSNTSTAMLTSYDRLFSILDKPVPSIPLLLNKPIYMIYDELFKALGYKLNVDYKIDTTLSDIVDYGFLPNGTIGNALEVLGESCGALITVDRFNCIVVKNQLNLESSNVELSGDNQIISIENIPNFSNSYTNLLLNHIICTINDEPKELIKLDNITVDPGINKLTNLKFSEGPILYVSAIEIKGGHDVTVLDYDLKAYDADITINNKSGESTISIAVWGICLETIGKSFNKTNDELYEAIGDKLMTVNCAIPRRDNVLHEYAEFILALGSSLTNNIKIELRGNPTITLTDLVDIKTPNQYFNGKLMPTQCKYSYTDALSCELIGVDADTRKRKIGYFIGPGMIIN